MTSGPHIVHTINPVLFEISGLRLWYYGLAYAMGFLGAHWWLQRHRHRLGWTRPAVYGFSIPCALSVLVIGHAFEIAFYEWSYYRRDPIQILNYWNGGMSTHGVLLGAVLWTLAYSYRHRTPFFGLADMLAVPAAFFMGIGRIGNFINGENYGPITQVWWAVKFPYAEGFRHPVDLYDALKNIGVVLILLAVRRRPSRPRGILFAHFIFWYGFLRLLIDTFREYGTDFLGIGRGQYFNVTMAVAGLVMMIWFSRRSLATQDHDGSAAAPARSPACDVDSPGGLWARRVAFAAVLLFSLTIPSGWSQGWLHESATRQAPAAIASDAVR